jgi:hypothetical protein
MSKDSIVWVWVFNGESSQFPSGIFSAKELAHEWICRNRLAGVLTAYPVDIGVYDWAVKNGFFKPKQGEHTSPRFVQQFTSVRQEHYHYEAGSCE